MRAAMNTMPPTTDAAFENILKRIERQEHSSAIMAQRTLTWCYYARRPLQMDELRAALVVEDEDTELRDEAESASSIVDCCLSFIAHDLNTGEVRFIHPSVQRWLKDEPQRRILLQSCYLAKTCLKYLNFDVFDVQLPFAPDRMSHHATQALLYARTVPDPEVAQMVAAYPFYRYASQFWGDHTKKAEHEPAVQKAAIALLKAENRRILMQRTTTLIERVPYWTGQTPLRITARLGLVALCNILVNETVK
jgi:hypothetical protein